MEPTKVTLRATNRGLPSYWYVYHSNILDTIAFYSGLNAVDMYGQLAQTARLQLYIGDSDVDIISATFPNHVTRN